MLKAKTKTRVGQASSLSASALTLLGESSRCRTLAEQAALRALIGPIDNRPDEAEAARAHAIRAETYKAAARLIAPPPIQQSKNPTIHQTLLCKL